MCHEADVGPAGVLGDRLFGLFDPKSGVVAAPEKDVRWRPALFLQSALDAEGVRIGFPDGLWLHLEHGDLLSALEAHFGFEVAVGSYSNADPLAPSLPVISNRYSVAPLHLVTTASLVELQQMVADAAIELRRFRPNILLETEQTIGFLEFRWVGHGLMLGDVDAKVTDSTKRCGMTLVAQPGLKEQPEILRGIVRHVNRSFGIYCEATKPGCIKTGADVTIT